MLGSDDAIVGALAILILGIIVSVLIGKSQRGGEKRSDRPST